MSHDLTTPLGEWQAWLATAPSNIGIGIDLEDVARWRGLLRLDALFTQAEREYCESKAQPAEHYAGHWCAKEAAFKALSGFMTVGLRELEVCHRQGGAPTIELISHSDIYREVVRQRLHISITHTPTLAAALAVYLPPTP